MSSEAPKIVIRYTRPTVFDPFAYGTIIQYNESHGKETEYYIQTSKNGSKPIWRNVAWIFDDIFKHCVNKPKFMDTCLKLYMSHNKEIDNLENWETISDILMGIDPE